MSELNYDSLNVGDELPEHVCGPITRATLALYCGASGDHNPIHVDRMLSMAYLAQLLTNWVSQDQLREYGVRFSAITPVHATVTCRGKIAEKLEIDGEPCVKLDLSAEIDDGTKTLIGDAVVGFG